MLLESYDDSIPVLMDPQQVDVYSLLRWNVIFSFVSGDHEEIIIDTGRPSTAPGVGLINRGVRQECSLSPLFICI